MADLTMPSLLSSAVSLNLLVLHEAIAVAEDSCDSGAADIFHDFPFVCQFRRRSAVRDLEARQRRVRRSGIER